MPHSTSLSPAQQQALDDLLASLPIGNIVELRSKVGHGKTTVLSELHQRVGGVMLTVRDFVDAAKERHPLSLEDALFDVMFAALNEHDNVIVDDLHVASAVMAGQCHFYPRSGLLDAPMTVLATYVADVGKKLIVGTNGSLPDPLKERRFSCHIAAFKPPDYRHLLESFVGREISDEIDVEKIYRFAPKLNAHQIKGACNWFRHHQQRGTASLIEYLRSQRLISNVELGEVVEVDLHALKGIDDVINSLEANIVLPLENDELAEELGLQPKRGVLLAGPPGTGKTTVGRALAHRLRGKFFLIDGTMISGTSEFYNMVHRVFEAAKENSPAVIFIDDSDVIFESGQEHGLYRYLLTMLDGLESKSAGRVCVMMTAMDVGNLPPALIRSGRVELWLEMRLPDARAREEILRSQIVNLPPQIREVDIAQLSEATESFTGADLHRIVNDGKALYGFDRARDQPIKPSIDYFLAACEGVAASKEKYAEAEARARANRPIRPPWFDAFDAHFVAEADDE